VYDFDDLLARFERSTDIGTNRPVSDSLDEVFDHRQGNIRLQQGQTDLAHRGLDVGFGQFASSPQAIEGIL
jgi:hypothetical protein